MPKPKAIDFETLSDDACPRCLPMAKEKRIRSGDSSVVPARRSCPAARKGRVRAMLLRLRLGGRADARLKWADV